MNRHAQRLTENELFLREVIGGSQQAVVAQLRRGWRCPVAEFVGVAVVYASLARLGQIAAISPGNITPIYPAAGFAVACVLLRGPRVWSGIWVGQLLGNAWAFFDMSDVRLAVNTSMAALVTSTGAVVQALAMAHLIIRSCGVNNPFTKLWHLFRFVGCAVVCCVVSPSFGLAGLMGSHVISWKNFGMTFMTWYLGDLAGVVLFVPLILTWPFLIERMHRSHRIFETCMMLLLMTAISGCVFSKLIPPQFVGSSLILMTLPLTLWGALRLSQPGVAILVNTIGVAATFATMQGFGPFATHSTYLSLDLLQLFVIVTMIAGLTLAITVEQLQRMKYSLRKLSFAVDQAVDAVFLLRRNAAIDYVNAQATHLLGYAKTELCEMTLFDFDPTFSASKWSDWWNHQRHGETLRYESIMRRFDGSVVPVEVCVHRVEIGETEFACASLKDISTLKREEGFRDRLEQILNSSTAVIYEKDLEGRYEFVNRTWGQLFHVSQKEVIGKTDYDMFPSEMADAFCRNDRQVIDSRQSLQVREMAPHADGLHAYISVKVPVWDAAGEIRGVAGISTDISELIAAKEELKNSERLAAIGQMITGLAHECRNALQRSQACLSMLTREVRGQPKATDYAHRLQVALEHLYHVFDDLRSYAAPLVLQKRSCNLKSLIEETWNHIVAVGEHEGSRLKFIQADLDLRCNVDAFRMKQVFRNTLENALSAVSGRSTVTVECSRVLVASGSVVQTTVRDQGPGFSPEQRSQAFKPFYTTKTTGTGLGLAIARRIVESHGGQIEIDGDSSTGGMVVITLPQ